MNNKDKIKEIVKRTNVSKKEAKVFLKNAEYDLLEAIIEIEMHFSIEEKIKKKSTEILDEIKKHAKNLNGKRLVIRNDEKTYLDVPVIAGTVGIMIAPIIGLAGVLLTKSEIIIITEDDEEINISNMIIDYIDRINL